MATRFPDLDVVRERRLLRQVAGGDSAAFAEIYEAYEGRLYGFCHRLTGSDADASDLVQETFLRVMSRVPEMDTSTLNLSAYLYTTARNLFYKQIDRSKRIQLEDRMEERAGPSQLIDEQPEAAALLSQQQADVRSAHDRLSPRQRMVLSLREVEERSYADIGTVLGMNENAVAQLLSRARIRLREELRIEQVDASRLPEECRQRLPTLSAYMDGQLRGAKRDELERHVEDCEHCRRVLAAFGDASHRYRAFLPLALPLAALWPATAHAAESAGIISSAADALAAHSGAAGAAHPAGAGAAHSAGASAAHPAGAAASHGSAGTAGSGLTGTGGPGGRPAAERGARAVPARAPEPEPVPARPGPEPAAASARSPSPPRWASWWSRAPGGTRSSGPRKAARSEGP